MPDRLFTNAAQLANITSSPDAGTDSVPGNVLKLALVALAGAAFTPTTILTSAAWTTAMSAMDQTKIVITPYIDNFKAEPGKMLTEGGNDTTTFNGVPRLRSTGYTTISGKISGADAALITNLRKLASKSGVFQHGTRLGVYFLHEGSGISTGPLAVPVPIYNMFFGDAMLGGLGASDDYEFEAHLEGGWSNGRAIYEAGFVAASLKNV